LTLNPLANSYLSSSLSIHSAQLAGRRWGIPKGEGRGILPAPMPLDFLLKYNA